MATRIEDIPLGELQQDLRDSYEDINNCAVAIRVGVTTYSGGEVNERLKTNQKIAARIEAELARRMATGK